jgi:poly(A) polymerase
VNQVAINTDKRIASGKSINPAFFYAALLWENYLHQLAKAKKRNMPFAEAQMHAAGKVIDRQRIKTAIPKFAEQFIRDIWILQPKLAAPRSKQIVQLSEHPRFRAGFDFLLLREQCGDAEHPLSESTNDMGDWWQTYQTLSEQEQQQAIDEFDENIRRGAYKKGQRGRGRNRQESKTQTTDNATPNQNSTKQNKADDRAEKGRNEQSMVNDSSNIPARRRRAASQSKAGRTDGGRPNVQQVEQDNNELAQLQQLSLASNKQSANQQVKPKPLFVIEHENVVPPLQKQLSADNTSKRSKAAVRKQASTNQDAPQQAVKAERVNSSTQLSNTSQPEAQASASQARPARSIARSPALVSMNNEPIPHKRRRRQPTVDSASNIEVQGSNNSKGSNGKAQPAAKYAKKAPKPAVESTDKSDTKSVKEVGSRAVDSKDATKTAAPARAKKSVKASPTKAAKAKQDTSDQIPAIKVTDNKGPVPSKRRRRQPSTESA